MMKSDFGNDIEPNYVFGRVADVGSVSEESTNGADLDENISAYRRFSSNKSENLLSLNALSSNELFMESTSNLTRLDSNLLRHKQGSTKWAADTRSGDFVINDFGANERVVTPPQQNGYGSLLSGLEYYLDRSKYSPSSYTDTPAMSSMNFSTPASGFNTTPSLYPAGEVLNPPGLDFPYTPQRYSPIKNVPYGYDKLKSERPLITSADNFLYHVQFKRSHRYYALDSSAPFNLGKGDVVIVEADRGEDIGVIRGKIHLDNYREDKHTAGHRGKGFLLGQPSDNKCILRRAVESEIRLIFQKVVEEELTLKVARDKVIQKRLPMNIVDAEYQYDFHKLTFFFEAKRRIDFRELVSELFSQYKTRIWMAQVDTSPFGMKNLLNEEEDEGSYLAMKVGLLPTNAERDEILKENAELCSTDVMTESLYAPVAYNSFANLTKASSAFSAERNQDVYLEDVARLPLEPLNVGDTSGYFSAFKSAENILDITPGLGNKSFPNEPDVPNKPDIDENCDNFSFGSFSTKESIAGNEKPNGPIDNHYGVSDVLQTIAEDLMGNRSRGICNYS